MNFLTSAERNIRRGGSSGRPKTMADPISLGNHRQIGSRPKAIVLENSKRLRNALAEVKNQNPYLHSKSRTKCLFESENSCLAEKILNVKKLVAPEKKQNHRSLKLTLNSKKKVMNYTQTDISDEELCT